MGKQKNFRKRPEASDEDEDMVEGPGAAAAAVAVSAEKKKKKKKKKKASAGLSFGDVEDGEQTSIPEKKKAIGRPDLKKRHKHRDNSDKASRAPPPKAFSNTSIDYSATTMHELTMSTPAAISRPASHAPAPAPPLIDHTAPSYGVTPDGITVPNASAIKAAKEKRERMRMQQAMGASDEATNQEIAKREREHEERKGAIVSKKEEAFIPISGIGGGDGKSRLIRDEDADDEGDISFAAGPGESQTGDERGRIGFANGAERPAPDRKQVHVEQDDEEFLEFERAQLRKVGVGKGASNSKQSGRGRSHPRQSRQDRAAAAAQAMLSGGWGAGSVGVMSGAAGNGQGEAKRLAFDMEMPQIETVEMTEMRLKERLGQMKQMHQGHQHELKSLNSTLEGSASSIESFDERLKEINHRYVFFQKTRDHVLDLLGCLDAKMPEIDAALDKIRDVRQRRRRHQRREFALGISDDYEEVKHMVAGYQAPLVEKEPGKAGFSDSEEEDDDDEGGVDALGRDRAYMQRNERRSRIAARKKRREKRAEMLANGGDEAATPPDNGLGGADGAGDTSESEGGSDGDYWVGEHERGLRESKGLFDEVDEDFASIGPIKRVLEEWKRGQSQSYKECYVSTCLPTLFSPFIKFELLHWNPMETATIDHFNWYDELVDYGVDADGDMPTTDEDFDLVPRLIQYIVVPYLRDCISDSYNPLSRTHNERLLELIKEVLNYVEPDTDEFKQLLLEVFSMMHKTLDNLPVPYPTNDTEAEVTVFCRKLFDKSVKLLRNLVMWHGVLSDDVLQRLCMDKLVSEKQVPYIKNAPAYTSNLATSITVIDEVMQSFPPEWLTRGNTVHSYLVKMLALVKRQLSRLDRACTEQGRTEDHLYKARRLVRLLVVLNERADAAELSRKYDLKMTL